MQEKHNNNMIKRTVDVGMTVWAHRLSERPMGYNELLYICNTYQFSDYSRYDFNLFDEADKRAYRDAHFETDLENAFQLGTRLVEAATELNK